MGRSISQRFLQMLLLFLKQERLLYNVDGSRTRIPVLQKGICAHAFCMTEGGEGGGVQDVVLADSGKGLPKLEVRIGVDELSRNLVSGGRH